jgi:cell division protein FtsB
MRKTMLNIFDVSFWFDITPVRTGNIFTVGFFILFAAFIIAGAVARITKRNAEVDKAMKHFLENAAGKATTWGILGFLWLFFTFEEISFFGSRFWFLLWAGGVGYAAYKLSLHWRKEMPEERLRRTMSVSQNKYLPRRAR